MRNRAIRVLDEHLARIRQGESIEACLTKYEGVRKQLEPLLHTAQSISAMPRVVLSDKFIKAAKGRLIARIHHT